MARAETDLPIFGTRGAFVLAGLLLAVLGTTLPQATSAPVVGVTADVYGTTEVEASWTVTIVLVVAAVSTPFVGRLGDAFGARRVIRLLLPVVALGLITTALAPTLGGVIAGRVLVGIGGGALPLAVAIVPHAVRAQRRATAIGLLTAMLSVGVGFGVVVAGLLVDHWGMRALSWVPLGLVLVAEAILLIALPHVPRRQGVHLNVGAAAFLASGTAVFLLALTEAPRSDMPWLWVPLAVCVGMVLLWLWLRRERQSPAPLLAMHLSRGRAVWSAHVTALLFGATLFGTFMLVPAFAESAASDGVGLSATVTIAGLLLLPATLAMLAVSPLTGVVRRWVGARATVMLGASTAAGGTLVLLIAQREPATILVATVLVGTGVALGSAGLVNGLVDAVSPDVIGRTIGVNTAARQMGGAIGVAMGASVLVARLDESEAVAFADSFTTLLAYAALAVIASTLVPGHFRRVPRR